MTGRTFETEVQQSARHMRFYYQRVSSASARGSVATRFVHTNPFDSYFVVRGLFVPIEMKSVREHGSFPFVNLKEHQEAGLSEALEEGGCPFVFINMRRLKDKDGSKPRNRAWLLPYDRWAGLKGELEDIGRRSIPYQWFEDGSRFAPMARLPRHEKRPAIWDLLGGLTDGAKIAQSPQYGALLELLDPIRFKRKWEEIGADKAEVSW